MIHDMNFKFTEKRDNLLSGEKAYHVYILVRNGLYAYSPQSDEKYECVEFEVTYLDNSAIFELILRYYGILVANRVVSIYTTNETAKFLKENFPNEFLVQGGDSTYIMAWRSDVCSDELKTTIELMI